MTGVIAPCYRLIGGFGMVSWPWFTRRSLSLRQDAEDMAPKIWARNNVNTQKEILRVAVAKTYGSSLTNICHADNNTAQLGR